MDKTIQQLLDILKNTYFFKEIKFSVSNPEKLYLMAKENGISGTIYQTIKDKIKNEEILAKFKKDYYFYIADDTKKTELAKKITDEFNRLEINHIYLKGMSIKHLYNHSYMRSKGDIDVLVKESDFEKASMAFKNLAMQLEGFGPVHDAYHYGDMEIELHRRVREEDKFLEFDLLDDMFQYEYMVDGHIIYVDPEIELIYLLYHIKKHFYSTGVGLRSIIDIPIYLYQLNMEINKTRLKELLIQTGILDFFENLVLICDKCFNLDLSEKFNITKELDEDLYNVFLEYVIRSGVHGLGIDFNAFTNRFASLKKKNTTRFKSLFRMVFPKYITIKYKYPKLLKYKVFLPIGWLFRGFSVLFKQPKRIKAYFKQIKTVDKEEVLKVSDLFNKMGL
ncbi:MAG: nucleotidyltransferase family protein [Tenericutes bacterium]|nr:nucleotidyltransferase family protein [Mycoplasmatota bacterium]